MKNFKKLAICVLVGCGFQSITAQEFNPKNMCGTGVPSQQWEMQFQEQIAQMLANRAANKTQQSYVIPVIIHVIHGGQAVGTYPNLAQGQLNSQIQVLNNDYAGTGYNTANYPANAFATWASTISPAVAPASLDGNGRVAIANCNVQFCLALKDPSGNILTEPGIERINYTSRQGWNNPASSTYNSISSFQNYIDGTIKPQTIWDVTKYLNIWVTDGNLGATGGLLGYATFPPGTGLQGLNFATGTSTTDGFWCYAQAFGSVNIFPSGVYMQGYTRGRTSTHEIGHYLGLRHIWGDGTCSTDYCNDTPKANDQNFGSPVYPYNVNLCSGSGNGEMFMNFMDYTNDNSKYMYTTDQANRIQTAMANSPNRKYLGTHGLCSVSNMDATAMFTSPIVACTGVALNLTNTSSGWPAPTFNWSASGGTFTPSQQATSPSINFSAPGVYTITLSSSNGTTPSVYTKTINVTSPTLILSSNSQTVCQGNSAVFLANGVDTYTWQPGDVENALVTFSPQTSQTYTCFATEINGCTTSGVVELVVSTCVGIEAYKQDEINVLVYPNPAKELLNLQINNGNGANPSVNVVITDAVGRTIRNEQVNIASGQVYPVNISSFDHGIYFIKVENQSGATHTVKFIKEN